jgi:hypothetical protein
MDFSNNYPLFLNNLEIDSAKNQLPLRVTPVSLLFIRNIKVNGVTYPFLLLKGSNDRKYWTREYASTDALLLFLWDYNEAFGKINDWETFSMEFRKSISYGELLTQATRILAKKDRGEYDKENGYFEFEADYKYLREIAYQYDVDTEWAEGLYTFLEQQMNKPSWWDRHPFLSGIIIGLIVAFILLAVNKFWSQLKKLKVSLTLFINGKVAKKEESKERKSLRG